MFYLQKQSKVTAITQCCSISVDFVIVAANIMSSSVKDLPYGPLTKYRQSATFNWKTMKTFITTEEIVKFEQVLHEEMLKHPLLHKVELTTPCLNEQRRVTKEKLSILYEVIKRVMQQRPLSSLETLSLVNSVFALDMSLGLKYTVNSLMFAGSVMRMGSERHKRVAEQAVNGKVYGCVCFTEVSHGTNAQGLRTTATYDLTRKQFILHTPDFEAAKCYICFGKSAKYGLVYANLILPTGENRGVHTFLVELHDDNLKPHVGITTADLGHKIGANGVDNAIIIFNQYPVPKDSLLNQIGDVTEDGKYVPNRVSAKEIYQVNLKGFAESRVRVLGMTTSFLVKALTIAVRYAAVRKQFGPSDDEEVSIIEYQTHQYRLFPYLALAYASKIFCQYVFKKVYAMNPMASVAEELHAITSGAKSVVVWMVRDAIQECREACGGHGYLKASGIGEIRNSNDLNCTSEGENNVIIQQTSNWLLKKWPSVLANKRVKNPLHSVQFLNNAKQILDGKFCSATIDVDAILDVYKWLVCYTLKTTYDKYQEVLKHHSQFHARNETQVFYAKTLATVYVEHLMLTVMNQRIAETDDTRLQNVLLKLLKLLGCWCLDKHTMKLYSGGYIIGTNAASLIQETILILCAELKDDAVALVDAIAHPDFITNSVLGHSDGEVYKHLEAAIFQNPHAFGRPEWWNEIVERPKMPSKI